MKSPIVCCFACGGELSPWFSRSSFKYLRCSSCHSCVTDPVPAKHQILTYYAGKFRKGNYLLLRHYAKQYLRVYKQFVDVIGDRCAKSKIKLSKSKILDVGCFTGDFLQLMQKEGVSVYGTELQKEAVEMARRRFPGRIFQADLGTRKFPKHKYEIITLLGLIEHVTEPESLLESVHKILKPGGLLVIQTPDAGSELALILGKWWPPLAPIEHIHIFSSIGLKLFLASCGFTNIVVERHVKWLPVAYVYAQFSTFGHHFGKLLFPFGWLLSRLPAEICLPFYGGEMIVTARKGLRRL